MWADRPVQQPIVLLGIEVLAARLLTQSGGFFLDTNFAYDNYEKNGQTL